MPASSTPGQTGADLIPSTTFNLYRSASAAGPLTSPAHVPSQAPGSTEGFAYSYDDLDGQSGQTY